MIMAKRSKAYLFRRKMQILAYHILGQKIMSRIYYRIVMKRPLHLYQPKLFSEKVCWYKIFECPKNPLIIQCSDKYAMREYIEKKGYGENLPSLIGVWDTPEEIDFSKLPNKFALKCNHGCAYNIICDDKSKLSEKKAKDILNEWLSEKFGEFNVEPHYDKIEKKIICEEFLDSSKGFLPVDYKIHCFDGVAQCLMKCTERTNDSVRFQFYDRQRNPLDYTWRYVGDEKLDVSEEVLSLMYKISEDIAKDFPFVRVDFYLLNEKPIIGELSFTPAAGLIDYISTHGDEEIGKMWNLDANIKG